MKKPRKERVELKKNRSSRRRQGDFTRRLSAHPEQAGDLVASERISGKGDLTRKRTVLIQNSTNDSADGLTVEPMSSGAWRGHVLEVFGLESLVQSPDGSLVRCTLRQVLRKMLTRQRHVLAAGDWVRVLGNKSEGTIESIEPRIRSLCRSSRGRRHVIVANVDQVVLVASAREPTLKPGLLDRLLVAAESNGIRPILCINKIDLVEPASLIPLAGVYARMGYPVILCSIPSGQGLERLRYEMKGCTTAMIGQSGVGKSSILNALDPTLRLPIATVSRDNNKGRHTTTTAKLLPLSSGGWYIDTPGVRQFQPWEIVPAEVHSAFRDIRPLANLCRFPNCTHSHEVDCAVKNAVADGLLDTRRWESCRHLSTPVTTYDVS